MELLGGGFYEPILSIIPEEDRRGQIEMMSAFLEKHFGRRPRGLWLTERVWEPSLASTLAKAGIEYTLLDENHFHSSHLPDLRGSYVTEDQGYPVRLLAIDQKLRYLIPFRDIDEIGRYFDDIRNTGGGWAILGDDGEKFGLWPGTKAWVYEKGWLERFLRFLEERRIPTLTYAEALAGRAPEARIYPPPASYMEMMEWVLEPEDEERFQRLRSSTPAADARGFLRAGSFPDFFRKYAESRHLRDRMLGISQVVRKSGSPEAVRELYKGQGNDPYWHGVFGGLYLPHLREAAYQHLLKAEALCPVAPGWTADDEDLDGRPEYVWRSERFGLRVETENGGTLAEIDYYPLSRNLSDVLSRRRESYHRPAEAGPDGEGKSEKSIHEIAKVLPPGTESLIRPDPGPRRSAVVRFFEHETDFSLIAEGGAADRGDFGQGFASAAAGPDRLTCEQSGRISVRSEIIPVHLRKEFVPLGRKFRVMTSLRNDGRGRLRILLADEWNLYQIPEEIRTEKNGASLAGGALRLIPSDEAELRVNPVKTLSQSESGFDTIHQGFCLMWLRRIDLGPGESASWALEAGETDAF